MAQLGVNAEFLFIINTQSTAERRLLVRLDVSWEPAAHKPFIQ